MTQSSIRAFQNWSDRLLEMKTRKVMSCRVQAGASWWEGTDRGKWYRSVLRVPFYHILTLPRVPLDFVWTGSVRDVSTRFAKNWKVFMKKFFDQAIKLNELYWLTKKHLKAHIQNFGEKRVATSRNLFCPSVPYTSRTRSSGLTSGNLLSSFLRSSRYQNFIGACSVRNHGADIEQPVKIRT